jgi:4-hydroxyphenylpyruvate dioxygenase
MSKEVKSVEYGLEKYLKAQDFFRFRNRLCRIYVGNAKQSAHYYKTAFWYQSWRMPD